MNFGYLYKIFAGMFDSAFQGNNSSQPNRYSEIALLVDQIYKEADQDKTDWHYKDITKTPTYKSILKRWKFEQQKLMLQLVDYATAFRDYYYQQEVSGQYLGNQLHCQRHILEALLKEELPYTEEELMNFYIKYRIQSDNTDPRLHHFPLVETFTHFEKFIKRNGLSDRMKAYLYNLDSYLKVYPYPDHWGKRVSNLRKKIEQVLFKVENPKATATPFYFLDEDEFGKTLNQAVEAMEYEQKIAFYEVLHLAGKVKSGKPSAAFLKKTKVAIGRMGEEVYQEIVLDWFEKYCKLKLREYWIHGSALTYVFLEEANTITLKGLIFTLSHFDDRRTSNLLVRIAKRSFQKVPQKRFASEKIGNACIQMLAAKEGMEGFAYLTRLTQHIRDARILKSIHKLIGKKAEELNVSPRDIEELSVPSFNLVNGVRVEDFDDYSLEIDLRTGFKPIQTWINGNGKRQKTTPSAVKQSMLLKKKLKEIKEDLKLLQTQVTTQKNRLDICYLRIRSWTYSTFKAHYLEHPFLSLIAGNFIWNLVSGENKVSALWRNQAWEDANGNIIKNLDQYSSVELWHPIDSLVEEGITWRNRLESLKITQLFRQAHREIYVVTDAERETGDYSNRMAAHILYQSQFKALTQLKGWSYRLLGNFDNTIGTSEASLYLGNNLKAYFYINVADYQGAYNMSGTWEVVSTDFISFERNSEKIPLEDIAPLTFSEVMRNVDMFIGVTSIGNNPNWVDNDGEPQHAVYWHDYSFSRFSKFALSRKELLVKLLPRLKIKNVVSIEGKFLKVRGKLRTYRIHIGSTHILMEPNDQYLCIVQARSTPSQLKKLYLPFEGDSRLSILISKAFLLADDDKITDPQILEQIRKR